MTLETLVEIVCDGGTVFGLGHLRRSTALGRRLEQRGHRVRLVAASDEGRAALSETLFAAGDAALRIVDLPYDGGDFVRQAEASGIAVLALDYHGAAAPDISVCLFDDSGVPTEGRRVRGLDYAIIRPDVAERGQCPEGDGVIVMIGGGDIYNNGPEVARDLAAKGQRVTLIRGPLCSDTDDQDGYETLTTPDDLAERMAGCAWAVSNGGTSMLEFMSLGKAVHVVPQTEQERRFAEKILARKGLIGVGADTLAVEDDVALRHTGTMAGTLVDGRGLDRISDLAEGLMPR